MKSVATAIKNRKAAIHITIQPYKNDVDIIRTLLTSSLKERVSGFAAILIRKANEDGNDLEVLYPELMAELRAGKFI